MISKKKLQIYCGVVYATATLACIIEFFARNHTGDTGATILIVRLLWLGLPLAYGAMIGMTGVAFVANQLLIILGFEVNYSSINKQTELLALTPILIAAGFYQWVFVAPRIFMKVHQLFRNFDNQRAQKKNEK